MDSLISLNAPAALIIKRVFHAPIERVFEAWTNAEVLAQWFGPVGFEVTTTDIDLRTGGKYRIVIQSPEGEAINHFGQYLEIIPPTKLIFTWILEKQPCKGSENQCADTLVSIDFRRIKQGTEVVLIHERLPSKEAYEGHKFGWESTLDSLSEFVLNA